MFTKITLLTGLVLATLFPVAVQAQYLDPYDVLTAEDFMPVRPRNGEDRIAQQQEAAQARREREQAEAFAIQNPPEEDIVYLDLEEFPTHGAAPEQPMGGEVLDGEVLSLLRALERIKSNQAEVDVQNQLRLVLAEQGLHSGAPLADLQGKGPTHLQGKGKGLAPTGPETVLAVMAMFFAVGYTVYRARRSEKYLRTAQGF